MKGIFPTVGKGDRLTGVNVPSRGAAFFHNGRPIGEIVEPAFAQAFFGIWLDPRTSRPDFRSRLLGERPERTRRRPRQRPHRRRTVAAGPDRASAPRRRRVAYGAFAIPLAMGALPLYVHLPKFYGEVFGVSLAALGVLLLALRAFDASSTRCSARGATAGPRASA